jgi:hypothetical protein
MIHNPATNIARAFSPTMLPHKSFQSQLQDVQRQARGHKFATPNSQASCHDLPLPLNHSDPQAPSAEQCLQPKAARDCDCDCDYAVTH